MKYLGGTIKASHSFTSVSSAASNIWKHFKNIDLASLSALGMLYLPYTHFYKNNYTPASARMFLNFIDVFPNSHLTLPQIHT